jgi:hypothetical protein
LTTFLVFLSDGCVGVTLRSAEYAAVSASLPSGNNPAESDQLIFEQFLIQVIFPELAFLIEKSFQ